MKMKRALSFLLVLTMLLSLCVPVASAAGTDYKAGITVSKVDDAKLSVSVDVGPSGASTKIQGVQSFVLAFDMSVLKAVLKNGNAFELTTSPAKKAMAYYEFENPSTLEVWTGNVYAYANAEKTTGFLIIQPSNGETLTLTAPTSLTKVYLGFQEGKSIADVNPKTVRFATAEELEGMSEDKALKLNDGSRG